mmetsp:Transcript_17753/g.49793  ORF Transcript_17753/g.49793 Transcript_17753/m.49793 type:complete len:98 (+) Transcript_17753:494-787(+)
MVTSVVAMSALEEAFLSLPCSGSDGISEEPSLSSLCADLGGLEIAFAISEPAFAEGPAGSADEDSSLLSSLSTISRNAWPPNLVAGRRLEDADLPPA